MLITDDIFQAFLQCETKSHLKLAGAVGDHRAFPDWEHHLVEDYKRQCHRQLRADFGEDECLVGVAFPQDLEKKSVSPCDGLYSAGTGDAITPPRLGTVGFSWHDEPSFFYSNPVCAKGENH